MAPENRPVAGRDEACAKLDSREAIDYPA